MFFWSIHAVNPRYNDRICYQRCCHYNEFAVVKNPSWTEWYVRKVLFCSYFIKEHMFWMLESPRWGDSNKYQNTVDSRYLEFQGTLWNTKNICFGYLLESPRWGDSNKYQIQSTLVISNSKGPSEILRDIRSLTYQICRIEEKIIRTTTFNKYICVIGLLKLEMYWKYCGKEEKLLLRSNFSSFPQYFFTCC